MGRICPPPLGFERVKVSDWCDRGRTGRPCGYIPIFIKFVSFTSTIFRGGAGGARAPPEFGGLQKGRSLISAYESLATTVVPRSYATPS